MASKSNVLLVISKFPPEYSGPGVRIPRLYEWLNSEDKKYDVTVLCNGIEQVKSKQYIHNQIPVRRICAHWVHTLFSGLHFIPQKWKHSFIYQSEFLQTLFTLFVAKPYRNIELFHIAGHSGGTAAALLYAKIKNIPVLMELVTANAPYRQKFLLFFKTPEIDNFMVVALTKDMERKCLSAGLNQEKIWMRPNPVDEEKFFKVSEDQKVEIRKKISGFSEKQIVLANVAKMMPQKNQILIVETLKYLPSNYVALIAGPMIKDGPLKERDQKYISGIYKTIEENKLEDRVHLVTDFVSADEYMKSADIYLMPAWNEGFGTPMMEAMACGLPVIANKSEPAFCEWIEDDKNGYLCDINEPQQWAKAIDKISHFVEEQRLNVSREIHKKAGQQPIYNHYKMLIEAMIKDDKKHGSETKNR